MGRDTSKGLIVARNNRAGVGKNSDHLTPRRWQPLEVTTSPSLFVCLFMKEYVLLFGIYAQ